MRVLLLGWGSRGDVQPLLALGRGLRDAGHEVELAAGTDSAEQIAAAGLIHRPFRIDIGRAILSPSGLRWLGGSPTPWAEADAMTAVVAEYAPALVEGVLELVDGSHDLYVSGSITAEPVTAAVAVRGGAHVIGLLQPTLISADPAASVFSLVRRRSPLNRAWGLAATRAMLEISREVVDGVRRGLGLSPRRLREHLLDTARTPTLLAASPLVVPPDPAWPDVWTSTGWWVDHHQPALGDHLAAFLAAGAPPVYVGFGSMPTADAGRHLDRIVTALRTVGVRGVIGGTAGPPPGTDLGPDLFRVGSVSHETLFPRMRAVVHHGGAGTTGAALRSGRPSGVVAHVGDQPYWGRRTHELGAGPAPLRSHDLDQPGLTRMIGDLVTRTEYVAPAARLGERLRAEDGVALAVARLEDAVRRARPGVG